MSKSVKKVFHMCFSLVLQWHNLAKEGRYCLDSGNPDGKEGVKASMYICHGMGANQVRLNIPNHFKLFYSLATLKELSLL